MSRNVIIEAKCHKCEKVYPEFWVTRNSKGDISTEGAVCGNCGSKNCIHRVWTSETAANVIMPIPEDGQIHRFEYSYTDENGKKINKKINPADLNKHFEQNKKR